MSEVASRPSASRGRGSGRGGRGGFAGRGGRRTNGDKPDTKSADGATSAFDDEGDIGELRKLYGGKTGVIREMFPDWSEVDVLFALQETNGDENEAVTRIAEGNISQWGEVSKTKKPSKPKAQDAPSSVSKNDSSTAPRNARGGRAVSEGGRGRGGRAADRGGRGRGRATQAAPNGTRSKENQPLSVPTEESPAWTDENLGADTAATKAPPAETTQPAAPPAKTWASMLRQSTVPKPAVPKAQEPPAAPAPSEPTEPQPATTETNPVEPEPQPEPAAPEEEPTPVVEQAAPATTVAPSAPAAVIEPEVALSPSHDELTKTNLQQVVDDTKPPTSYTTAGTADDSWDPRQSTTATPLSAAQQQHQAQGQTPSSSYATSAIKPTAERTIRTPTHQRRVLDQEEAVRMPGNREVDRAAVQFGAFHLGGGEDDVDGDREEPETRTQPPADSPVSHPRTSLPPVAQPGSVPEKPGAPGLGAPQASGVQSSAPANAPTQPAAAQHPPYGRFGQPGAQDGPQKPLDPFSHQAAPAAQPPFDSFSAQTSQPPSQQPGGAFSSAPSDYSSYYTANQQERNPYTYYGHQFAQQQGAHGQPDSVPGQQRPFGSYGASQQADNLSQYPQSGAGVHTQPRFGAGAGEAQNSGHSTPNPTTQAQQQQQQQAATAPGSQPQYPNYHPYYNNPYYQQYYGSYGQGGFGPYGGKGGMYGQPYGMSPSGPFEHANSPASFAQSSLHRESGLGSGLGDYARTGAGASQAGGAPGLGGSSSFGSVHDSFARGASSFQSQGPGFDSQAQAGDNPSANDDLKPFGDKAGSGPSPSLGGARPGSATAGANAPASQSGLPPPQASQMGAGAYAGYPNHLQGHGLHGSSAYGMGGTGGANQHGNTPYGSYGQGGFGGSGGGYYGSGQQQHQQHQQHQQRGWGGNYH